MPVITHKTDAMIQGIAVYTLKNTDLNHNNFITNPDLYPEMQTLGSYRSLLYHHLNIPLAPQIHISKCIIFLIVPTPQ